MKLPEVVHPKSFNINGYIFEIVSYIQLTDDQAAKIATHYFDTHSFKKKDRGTLFRVVTLVDGPSGGFV